MRLHLDHCWEDRRAHGDPPTCRHEASRTLYALAIASHSSSESSGEIPKDNNQCARNATFQRCAVRSCCAKLFSYTHTADVLFKLVHWYECIGSHIEHRLTRFPRRTNISFRYACPDASETA